MSDMHIPRIDPVTEGPRPLWSVMIPAYNAANYLAKTIRSVLVQDPGPELMQIEVVDDHSLKEDLLAVVEQVGPGRVGYYRQPRNVGAVETFNTCVRRARGHWVHILHGDDTVLPGFYERLQAAIVVQPAIGAAFCRYLVMNEDGHRIWTSDLEASEGVIPAWIDNIAVRNRIMAPAIIVARRVYEELGGYDTRLFHCADWDMWKRIAVCYPVWYEPTVLACYRVHPNSDTSRLVRTGSNVADARRSISITRKYLPVTVAADLTQQACDKQALDALDTASGMWQKRDYSGAWAQITQGLKTAYSLRVMIRLARLLRHFGMSLLRRSIRVIRRKAIRTRSTTCAS